MHKDIRAHLGQGVHAGATMKPMRTAAQWLLVVWLLVVTTACRGGAAARAAPLPQPTNVAQWLAIAVFVFGVWWVLLKILRG